jgi:hypothetical protein
METECVTQYGPNNSHENNWMFMPHPKCCKNITSTIPLPTIQERERLMSTSQIPQPSLVTLVSINKKRQDSKLINLGAKRTKETISQFMCKNMEKVMKNLKARY